jgi:hypothetical protein
VAVHVALGTFYASQKPFDKAEKTFIDEIDPQGQRWHRERSLPQARVSCRCAHLAI